MKKWDFYGQNGPKTKPSIIFFIIFFSGIHRFYLDKYVLKCSQLSRILLFCQFVMMVGFSIGLFIEKWWFFAFGCLKMASNGLTYPFWLFPLLVLLITFPTTYNTPWLVPNYPFLNVLCTAPLNKTGPLTKRNMYQKHNICYIIIIKVWHQHNLFKQCWKAGLSQSKTKK